jgi:hypothetical protein
MDQQGCDVRFVPKADIAIPAAIDPTRLAVFLERAMNTLTTAAV